MTRDVTHINRHPTTIVIIICMGFNFMSIEKLYIYTRQNIIGVRPLLLEMYSHE
jgi:hypothetical protein